VFTGSNIAAGTVSNEGTLEPGFSRANTARDNHSPLDEWRGATELRIATCMDYMRCHLQKPLQIQALCDMAGLSTSHFFYLFKNTTGQTPIACFIRMRMGKACELLEESTLTVKEISALLGYHDRFYFSRLFKSVQGVSPRQYRNAKAGHGISPPSTDAALHFGKARSNQSAAPVAETKSEF
jgi:AraC-like DNA-binding protein